jgi:MFS family permease
MSNTSKSKYMDRTFGRTLLSLLAALLLPVTAAAQVAEPTPPPEPEISAGMILGIAIAALALMFVVAALVIHGATEFARSSIGYIRNETGETGVIGFVAIMGSIIGIFVAMLVVAGISAVFPPLALVGIALLLLMLVLSLLLIPANVAANIAVGHTLVDAVRADGVSELDTKTLWIGFLVGFVTLAAVNSIPIVGFLVSIAVGSLGVGAIVRYWRDGAYERPDPEAGQWNDGPSGDDGFGDDAWSDADPRDPTASDDEFGAPDDDGGAWSQRDERDTPDQRDQERDQWEETDSSKRDDSEEFW